MTATEPTPRVTPDQRIAALRAVVTTFGPPGMLARYDVRAVLRQLFPLTGAVDSYQTLEDGREVVALPHDVCCGLVDLVEEAFGRFFRDELSRQQFAQGWTAWANLATPHTGWTTAKLCGFIAAARATVEGGYRPLSVDAWDEARAWAERPAREGA